MDARRTGGRGFADGIIDGQYRVRGFERDPQASATVRNILWFQVTDTGSAVSNGKVDHGQVTMKLGITVED